VSATWYNSPERVAKLDEVARSWLGTPFRENSSAKGARGAVSCHQLVAAVYKESGFLSADFTPPVGYVHQLKTSAPQAIIDWIDANLSERFSAVEPAGGFLPGDLIALRDDNDVLKHLGIVVSGRSFVHVLRMTGARISHLHDATFAPRIARIRRPMP
jgi:hypothetical protein